MNYADTEKLRNLLFLAGLKETQILNDADLIVLNTCSVRQRAEDKVFGIGPRITRMKKARPLRVLLTSCMAQRIVREECEEASDTRYARELKGKIPWVDDIVEIGNYGKFMQVLEQGQKKSVEDPRIPAQTLAQIPSYLSAKQESISDIIGYVPISSGCNNFCSYCVVPYTRGKERHRGYSDIINHCENLIGNGYRLITLLGQNVNSWRGTHKGNPVDFPDLLSAVGALSGEYWLTFLTSHPKDFTEKLALAFVGNDRMCPYLNLAVQSGSDAVLSLMNRGYTRADFVEKVGMLRTYVPDVRLSTDIIVGFPGETDDDFQRTADLLEEIRFGMVYVSEYSPRKPSTASKLQETVSAEEKSARKKRLEAIQTRIMEEENAKFAGKKVEVLVTGGRKDRGFSGKTKDLREIRITTFYKKSIKTGDMVPLRIVSSSASGFVN